MGCGDVMVGPDILGNDGGAFLDVAFPVGLGRSHANKLLYAGGFGEPCITVAPRALAVGG